jgi:hypothetical protein
VPCHRAGEYLPYPEGKAAKPQSRQMHLSRFSASEAAAKARALKANGTVDFKEQARTRRVQWALPRCHRSTLRPLTPRFCVRQAWRAAACKYSCGVEYARKAGGEASDVLGPLLLNEAQCRLKLNEAGAAVQLCTGS